MRLFHRIGSDPPDAPQGRTAETDEVDGRIKALEAALEALQGLFVAAEEAQRELVFDGQETRSTLVAHEARFTELIFAVAEGISKVERTEARIRATVRRARAELEDGGTFSPALDAEATELRILDGGGGEEGPVQPLPASVEPPAPDLSDIPGDWSPEDLALLTGS